ncbi:rod shape-determining protein MreD [Noviherbaspirillum cavernae]|uniref:Rod shape-determining protein MreD n=1 Tax=Noviherbaspirillum cavernae TaxID=2320862 RepID=A0A418WX91_9BURK|nr:rod shape-determining protein MreD [Noviherbaspirillum cavernae]RJG04846.1 rod shape-determining protein MreD [Noviherbaspirillum cavernae]
MNRPHYILLPVNPLFIMVSLVTAFLLNLLPWGHAVGVPDFVALVLIFWSVHQPRKVGIGIAFVMGLLMDVHDATLLGENALSYTLLSYFAIMIHRRVLWFRIPTQALHVLPLILMMQSVQLVIRVLVSGHFPGWLYFSESLTTAALWPVVTWILLAPQRRAVNRDDNRPL